MPLQAAPTLDYIVVEESPGMEIKYMVVLIYDTLKVGKTVPKEKRNGEIKEISERLMLTTFLNKRK